MFKSSLYCRSLNLNSEIKVHIGPCTSISIDQLKTVYVSYLNVIVSSESPLFSNFRLQNVHYSMWFAPQIPVIFKNKHNNF